MKIKFRQFLNNKCAKCCKGPQYLLFLPHFKKKKNVKYQFKIQPFKDIEVTNKKIKLKSFKVVDLNIKMANHKHESIDTSTIEVMICECGHCIWASKDEDFFHSPHKTSIKQIIDFSFKKIMGA